MISATPSVFDASLSRSGDVGIESFVDLHAPSVDYTYYGAGKVALRDGLAGLVEPGENVLVPAYLSPAVVEPLHDLGLESRFYAIKETLEPDFTDLERRMDDDTVAVMSVNYFGFPQPGLETFASLTDEYDCYHIDDNAHAPLSVDGETLLGTAGDLGVTTLRKLLPVPDGAVLYCRDEAVREAFEPSSLAGVSDRVAAADCRYVATSVAETVLGTSRSLHRSVEALLSDGTDDPSSVDPGSRYEATKAPMSRFSKAVADAADPGAIRSARRENYRAWQRALAGRDDVTIVYDRLPEGISPYEFPVRADEPDAFLAELEDCGVIGAHTWPILRQSVYGNEEYDIANRLSEELVVLPVHQGIETAAIEAAGDGLRR
ncbi:DegT/DnrJ/EryC1/StrS family aminotransferase [Natrinema halophilum]|uniref:DegT/DnrJ/EryC1/StrS aminotransferase family protein n=1 Tax=Natrinema halophilum TaxID=1699371 RepID=A0A7D5KZ57_9EURY|nr:DegT/DnrJ/EryC1/StrS family aminotransferase [Natrinema halophilum]QLG48580.1 DegT/DnrJ/EryC1/StrS family aminotransferase [Natrinema halophilum]